MEATPDFTLEATPHETTHESGVHVALAAEKIGTLFGIPITNTLLTAWITMAILITLAVFVGRRAQLIPGKLQVVFEEIITFAHSFFTEVLDNAKLATRFLPLLLTLFLFIALANMLHFLPGVGSIGIYHGGELVPLLRSVNTDLNVTLALTLISVVVIEVAGVVTLGLFRYAGKFFNFSSPVAFFVGLVELVSEMARLVSFSFRLFGNIFAGEVLIGVIIFFAPYVAPVPVMAFETFVGVVQALIFMLLTLFFIKLAITDAHAEH
jgi:F-type H+-transporting ATPase subunit a